MITGALLHAAWNLCAKRAAGGLHFVWLFGLVSVAASLPFGVHAWLRETNPLEPVAWAAILASALVHVGYSLVLQAGYRASDFSIVYPVARGTGPLFAVLGAVLLLGESPSIEGWAGIAAIVLGIVLIASGARARPAPAHVLAGVFWGILTGIFIAAYTVVDAWAVGRLGVSPVLYYSIGLAIRSVVLAPPALRDRAMLRDQWRRHRGYIMAVGLLSPLAYVLVLFAMSRAPLSYVAPARELSMMLGVIIGGVLLKEALGPAKLLGAGLMVAGVVLLAVAR